MDRWAWYYILQRFAGYGYTAEARAPALKALRRLQANVETASFESLIKDVALAKEFAVSTQDILNRMYVRFPDKKETIELTELLEIVPMIFGAEYRSYPAVAGRFPSAIYAGSRGESGRTTYPRTNDDVLDRLIYLDGKYPQVGI